MKIETQNFQQIPDALSRYGPQIAQLNKRAFHLVADQPILGDSDDIIISPNLYSLLQDPQATTLLALQQEQFLGYTLALPTGRMNPSRAAETDTAYIYFTALIESARGRGIVGPLVDGLFQQLNTQGMRYVERDCVVKNGYADKVSAHYGRIPNCIVSSHDHCRFQEFGPERFFRIDVGRYLARENILV